jgi:hypothetical protein
MKLGKFQLNQIIVKGARKQTKVENKLDRCVSGAQLVEF